MSSPKVYNSVSESIRFQLFISSAIIAFMWAAPFGLSFTIDVMVQDMSCVVNSFFAITY